MVNYSLIGLFEIPNELLQGDQNSHSRLVGTLKFISDQFYPYIEDSGVDFLLMGQIFVVKVLNQF